MYNHNSYKDYQIGSLGDKIYVSRDLEDMRYKHIEVATIDEAYELIDDILSPN